MGSAASTGLSDETLAALEQLPAAAQAELARVAQMSDLVQAEAPGKQAQQHDDALDKYTGLAELRRFLGSGDVALVKASHFLTLASTTGGIFLRRQDLPTEAIVGPAMLERSFAELEAWDTYLQSPNQQFHSQLMRFPPFVIISYAWSAREHPDGDGRQLREMIAPAIEWYMAERAKLTRDGGVGGTPCIANPFDADGCDFCVFLD